MSHASFELHTQEGEQLADRLVRAICADLERDRLTRRQALDRVAEAIERIAAIDEGMAHPEPAHAIAMRLTRAFARAGYQPVDGNSVRSHYERWQRGGAQTPSQPDQFPAPVVEAGVAARALAERVAPLCRNFGFTTAVAQGSPNDEWSGNDPAWTADLVFYVEDGEVLGSSTLHCVLRNPGENCYHHLLEIALLADPATPLRRDILKREGLDYDALTREIVFTAVAIDDVNLAVNRLNEPERIALTLADIDGVPVPSVVWDGATVTLPKPDAPGRAMEPARSDRALQPPPAAPTVAPPRPAPCAPAAVPAVAQVVPDEAPGGPGMTR